jgi:hypothetical protein
MEPVQIGGKQVRLETTLQGHWLKRIAEDSCPFRNKKSALF